MQSKSLGKATSFGLAICFLQLIYLGAANTTGNITTEFVTTGLESSTDDGHALWMVYMAVSSVIILSIAMLTAFLIVYALKNTTKYQLEDLERQHALRVRKGLLHPPSRDSSRESSPNSTVQNSLGSSSSNGSKMGDDLERLRTKLMYVAPKDSSYGAFEEDIRVKWNKPLDKMPVAVDLPRLVKVINLFVEGKKVWPTPKEDSEERREKLILSFLTAMGEQFETQAVRDSIVASYSLYFHEGEQNVDISRRLGKFLGEVLGEDCKTLKILKVCNQAILAPAVVRMKYYIANDFPYNDVAGGWRITIAVFDEQVRVRHSKWEKSIESESFRFKWEFEMAFDIHMKVLLSIDLYISELQFGNADNEPRRKKLRQKINETCWGLAPPKDLWEMAM